MTEELITDYDIRGKSGTELTVETAWNIGKATADWLSTGGSIVVLAHPAQQDVKHAVTEGARLQGRNVVDGGFGDSEAVVSYITTGGLSGGIVISCDDGSDVISIEVYQEDGLRVEKASGLVELYELVQAGNFVPAAVKGELTAIA
jgi:phosphomannomutase